MSFKPVHKILYIYLFKSLSPSFYFYLVISYFSASLKIYTSIIQLFTFINNSILNRTKESMKIIINNNLTVLAILPIIHYLQLLCNRVFKILIIKTFNLFIYLR